MSEVYGYDLTEDSGKVIKVVYGRADPGPAGAPGGPQPWDAASGLFPAKTSKNDIFVATSAGTIAGVTFEVGDFLISLRGNASTSKFTNHWVQQQPAVNATRDAREEALAAAEAAAASAAEAARLAAGVASTAINVVYTPTEFNDRTNVQEAVEYNSIQLEEHKKGVRSISTGGTGASTVAGARSKLGLKSAALRDLVDDDDLTKSADSVPTRGNVDKGIANKFSATGTAPLFACRAYCVFDGFAGNILTAGNVSTVTKLGHGHFRLTFTQPMNNVWYTVTGMAQRSTVLLDNSSDLTVALAAASAERTQTADYVDITVRIGTTGAFSNAHAVSVAVFL